MRKKEKYVNLINEMSRNYRCVRFVNLSMSSLGVFSDECSTFLDMMYDIGFDKKQQRYIIKKMINITIRATYYIFCCRKRNWDSPDFFSSLKEAMLKHRQMKKAVTFNDDKDIIIEYFYK